MDENRPSLTAQMTAYCRWHHTLHDTPVIFEDHLAGMILGDEGVHSIESMLLDSLKKFNPAGAAAFPDRQSAVAWMMQSGAASPIVLARARYAEECLESAIAHGAEQYVILGAGLDTFPFRRPELMEAVTVFEVDHPASQGLKRRRLAELRWQCPSSLHFVPMDFARAHLSGELARTPYDPAKRTFFSWLGVSYYLYHNDVRVMMEQIAQVAPPGSELVFDYLESAAYRQETAAARVVRMLSTVRDIGEPMLSGFDARELASELDASGFSLLENLGPYDIQCRYFMGRTDHHRACEHAHFVRGEVRHQDGI